TMSRLARKPIAKPATVTVSVAGHIANIKGPKGELAFPILPGVAVASEADSVMVTATGVRKDTRPNVGTVWSLMRNAIEGVTSGFNKDLEIQGVGFRAALEGKTVVLSLGYVHPVRFESPEGVTVAVEKNIIKVSGIDKQKVGLTAAKIRAFKKPEPYKGKGIRYVGEVVRLKPGKKAATG
ncbi:MAG: ribosomal protein, partial [Candidatus Parcubacteria bacterium]